MGTLYLVSLADWFRAEGLTVIEYAGWQTRARSTGGYDAPAPLCVMWHHTASSTGTSAQADADYMCDRNRNPDAPIANVMVARDAKVWVLAAGATNTNGKGDSCTFSKGTVPQDSMNTRAVGIEICNNGVGEAYSQALIDVCFTVSLCLQRHLGMIPADCCTHQAYAPTRKVDPAKAGTTVQGTWHPASINSSGSWSVTDLRAEHGQRTTGGPSPPVPDGGDDMPDESTFKGWMRAVLDEGTAFGQTSWANTCEATLGGVQDLHNQIQGLKTQVAELTELVKSQGSTDD